MWVIWYGLTARSSVPGDRQEIKMYEVVQVGPEHLVGEVIGLDHQDITIQVYEETSGLRPGTAVYGTGASLSVELGPGLLSSIFDGIQRPLPVMERRSGVFIGRGIQLTPLYRRQRWQFTPVAPQGSLLSGGAVLGTVPETPLISHKVMVPPNLSGRLTWLAPEGAYTLDDQIAVIADDRGEHRLTMLQRWPVRHRDPIAVACALLSCSLRGNASWTRSFLWPRAGPRRSRVVSVRERPFCSTRLPSGAMLM